MELEKEGLSLTGIHLVHLEAPTDKLRCMEQCLYAHKCAPSSLRPSRLLVLCMVAAYSLSCADFALKAAAVPHAWLLRTRRLLKQLVVIALWLLLRVPNAALYGTLESRGFGLPDMLTRFRLRQVLWGAKLPRKW